MVACGLHCRKQDTVVGGAATHNAYIYFTVVTEREKDKKRTKEENKLTGVWFLTSCQQRREWREKEGDGDKEDDDDGNDNDDDEQRSRR